MKNSVKKWELLYLNKFLKINMFTKNDNDN